MSIASEITRLQGVKADILDAIADKGVTVPAGSALDDCPDLISSIQSGGGGGVTPDPAQYTTYLYYEKTYSYTKIKCTLSYLTDFTINSDDIVEYTINFQNAFNGSDLPQQSDAINSGYLCLFHSSQYPSGSREGRKISFAYCTDRWNTSTDPSNYHLRVAATNWQNGSYYYGSAGCVNIGDSIAADTTMTIRQGRDFIEVNGLRSTLASPELIVDYETNQVYIPMIESTGAPLGLRIYEIKIKDKDGNLKYRFVPCIKTSDNAHGYYEVVTGQFAYNGDWAQQSEQPTPGPFMPV